MQLFKNGFQGYYVVKHYIVKHFDQYEVVGDLFAAASGVLIGSVIGFALVKLKKK